MNKSPSLLYIEDEVSIREEMLEILGFDFENIYVASNGQEGLELYKTHLPDVVISDIQMPALDGISMSEKILQINPDAKIILTTAFNEESHLEKARSLGVVGYVKKPVNLDELFGYINKAVEDNKGEMR